MGGKGNLRYLSVLNFAKNNIFLIVLMIIRLKKKEVGLKNRNNCWGEDYDFSLRHGMFAHHHY